MTANQHFSANYQQARQKFLTAARIADAAVESFENSCAGVGGSGLFTDVAALGPKNASNVVFLISGTHGVEGFTGSAIQTSVLAGGLAEALPPHTSLVMVHALNPYGFAFLRRANEDNVDLNRNFLDHGQPYPVNPEYTRLAKLVAPGSMTTLANLCAAARIALYRLAWGTAKLKRVITQGQYTHPEGLFFGGNFATWSNRTLIDIVNRYLAAAERVVVLDFHTGLGPYGHGEIILNEPVESPVCQRATQWWGASRVKSTANGASVSSPLSGTVKQAFAGLLGRSEVTAAGLEFGTFPALEVFKVLREENWLHHHGGESHPDAARIKQHFLRMFYPADDVWKQEVLGQGRLVVKQALDAFAAL